MADQFIDITAEVCPLTFVKTKLALEKTRPGSTLEVRLKGAEPLENVPRSVQEHGHEIVRLAPEDPARDTPADVWRLVIRRV